MSLGDAHAHCTRGACLASLHRQPAAAQVSAVHARLCPGACRRISGLSLAEAEPNGLTLVQGFQGHANNARPLHTYGLCTAGPSDNVLPNSAEPDAKPPGLAMSGCNSAHHSVYAMASQARLAHRLVQSQVSGIDALLQTQHGLDDLSVPAVQLQQQATCPGSQPGTCASRRHSATPSMSCQDPAPAVQYIAAAGPLPWQPAWHLCRQMACSLLVSHLLGLAALRTSAPPGILLAWVRLTLSWPAAVGCQLHCWLSGHISLLT